MCNGIMERFERGRALDHNSVLKWLSWKFKYCPDYPLPPSPTIFICVTLSESNLYQLLSMPSPLSNPSPKERTGVLAELRHLDLSGRVTFTRGAPMGCGAFSEVFQGRYVLEEQGEMKVAIKRLRFYMDSVDVTRVSLILSFAKYGFLFESP